MMMKQHERIFTVHVQNVEGDWMVYGSYDNEVLAVTGAGEALDKGYPIAKVCTTVTYLAEDNGGGPTPATA